MKDPEIETAILGELYSAHYQSGSAANVHAIREAGGWEESHFSKVVDRLAHDGLIKAWTMGGNYRITTPGILYAEETGIAPPDMRTHNQDVREKVLVAVGKVYDDSGTLSGAYIQALSEHLAIDTHDLVRNIQVLENAGYVEPFAGSSFKITYRGLETLAEWRARLALEEEFDKLAQLAPHPRGRGLQGFLGRVIESYGWSQEEGVRTANEEIDLVIHRGREYYLVEAKWEKDPIEAGVVRELHGKLSNRLDVRGILVSISGFSVGARDQARDFASDRIIILFGPRDVHDIIRGRVSFDDKLDVKYGRLVTRREVVFD